MEKTNQPIADLNDQIEARLGKLGRIRERGEVVYKNGLTPKDLAADILKAHGDKTKEVLEGKAIEVSVAGRVMAIRDFGKAAFVRIQDRSGTIQVYFQKDKLGEEKYRHFNEDLDLGDLIYTKGKLFRTKTNELTIQLEDWTLLTKSLRPLPEKFHGIADVELRYRKRYLDLITSKESKDVFVKRFQMIQVIRDFFVARGFLEVETPMMHSLVGGATARPFKTHHNTLDMELFLRIAPELYLKRLVVGGFDRVFEINRNFRNEGISIQHNPEFTMLEFYQAYATYEDLMDLTEELFREVAQKICGSLKIDYQGTTIDLESSFARLSVEEAILKYSGFKEASKLRDRNALLAYGKTKHIEMDPKRTTGHLLMAIFDAEVEQHMIQPTFITRYPLDVSPLSRKNDKDPFVVDRFEFFIYGREMANAFSELNDPMDQRERFQAQVDAKKGGDDEACDMDDDYVEALEYGLPPTAGQGIGIDRMAMLFTNSASIRDVILFPQLKKK